MNAQLKPDSPVTLTIEPIEPSLLNRADNLLARAGDIKITSTAERDEYAELLRHIKSYQQALEAARKEAVKPLRTAVETINASVKPHMERATQAEAAIKRALSAWEQEQERKRREREAELRRQQEAEQARLRQEAERREAAERERARVAREKAEAAARAAEEAGRAEKAAAMREAARIKEEARIAAAEQEAEAKRAAAAMMPAAVVVQDAPKAAGVSTRKTWKFRVDDVTKLPAQYLIADEKKIGKVVRALGGDTDIPGITVWSEDVVAVRASA